MDRAGSGELPAKRKSPPATAARPAPCDAGGGAEAAAPAASPASAHCRAISGPTCSTPAMCWGDCHADGQEVGLECDSGRGKALRVCSAAAARGGADEGMAAAAADGVQPLSSLGSGGVMQAISSMPPAGLYHSYHCGSCCSRLSSSSSLAELEAAAAAAEAAAEGCEWRQRQHQQHAAGALAAFAEQQQQQQQQQQPLVRQERGGAMEEAGASLWADVPDDILKRVLERLSPSSLRVLRLVCRGWEAAASRLLCYLRPEALAGKQLRRRFPALHSLDLSNCCMGVDFASPRMLRLQSLLPDEQLCELAGLHRLEQLSLRGCSCLTGGGLARLGALRCSLTMLNLSQCTGLRDECLGALAAALPQLATLNLQGCSGLGDDGVAHLVTMPHLRHVLLPAGVTDAAMVMLTEMQALERVALRGCAGITTAGVFALLQHRGLRRIVISKCPRVSLEGLCCDPHLKIISDPSAAAASAATAADAALAGVAANLAGDMQLLIAEAV